MSNKAAFTINGNASVNRGYVATSGQVLTCALEDSSVSSATFELVATTGGTPTFENSGSLSPVTGDLDITLPATTFDSFMLRCTVTYQLGSRNMTEAFERIASVIPGSGHRKILPSETVQYDQNKGWSNAVNNALIHLNTGVGAPLADAAPPAIAAASAVGVSTDAAREDHTHAHGTQAGGTLHADVIAAGASGFMSGSDKTKLDNAVSTATASRLAIRDGSGNCAFAGLTATSLDSSAGLNLGITTATAVAIGNTTTNTLVEIYSNLEVVIDSDVDVTIAPSTCTNLTIGHSACSVGANASTYNLTCATSSIVTSPICREVASTAVQLHTASIVYATAAGSTKCTETPANAYTRVHDAAVTSVSETWTQAASGAGGSRTRRAQQGASGSAGGSVLEYVGEAGTVGTGAPGDYHISLGTMSTGVSRTGRFRLQRETTTPMILDIYASLGGSVYFDTSYAFLFQGSGTWSGSYVVLSGSTGATLTMQSGAAEFECQVSSAFDVITYAASLTVNCNLGNNHEVTLTGNVTTMTVTNLRDGSDFEMHFVQDATGGRTTVWDTEFTFATGVSNAIDGTANARTIYRGKCRNGVMYIQSRAVV